MCTHEERRPTAAITPPLQIPPLQNARHYSPRPARIVLKRFSLARSTRAASRLVTAEPFAVRAEQTYPFRAVRPPIRAIAGQFYFFTEALIWSIAFLSSAARSRKVCNGVEVNLTSPHMGNP